MDLHGTSGTINLWTSARLRARLLCLILCLDRTTGRETLKPDATSTQRQVTAGVVLPVGRQRINTTVVVQMVWGIKAYEQISLGPFKLGIPKTYHPPDSIPGPKLSVWKCIIIEVVVGSHFTQPTVSQQYVINRRYVSNHAGEACRRHDNWVLCDMSMAER